RTAQGATSYLRSLAVDEALALASPTEIAFFLPDALGSTLALTDVTGNVVSASSYEPFGVTTATPSGSDNPFQFTGREKDDTTGLYYYRARYYHPGLMRFIQSDPIGLGGGMNPYAYVGGNP